MNTSLMAFWLINVFEMWAMYVITGWRFTLSVVRYQISRRLTLTIVSLRSWSSVRKPIFALLQVFLAVHRLFIKTSFPLELTEDLQVLLRRFWISFRRFPSKEMWFYVFQAKSRSRTPISTWCKCKWQKHNVTFRRVFTHHRSETDGLRHT